MDKPLGTVHWNEYELMNFSEKIKHKAAWNALAALFDEETRQLAAELLRVRSHCFE